jgi:hypothetical protein
MIALWLIPLLAAHTSARVPSSGLFVVLYRGQEEEGEVVDEGLVQAGQQNELRRLLLSCPGSCCTRLRDIADCLHGNWNFLTLELCEKSKNVYGSTVFFA